ncbi:MAG: hypothetical protein ACOCV8_00050 [Spirochaetota bacterium]
MDNILTNRFLSDDTSVDIYDVSVKTEVNGTARFINKNELSILKKKLMYKCVLYKNEPFYIIIDKQKLDSININNNKELANIIKKDPDFDNNRDLNKLTNPDIIQSLFKPVFNSVKKFYYDVSLKELEFSVKDGKLVNFTALPKKDSSIFGYLLSAKYYVKDEALFDFFILLPFNLLKHLVFFLTYKDMKKFKDASELVSLLDRLEFEFINDKSFFPFKTEEFFNRLNEQDFRKIIHLLLSSSMLSYDMLYALSRVIESGSERVIKSLSKNLRDEFIQNTREKKESYDKRWIQVSNYHLLCNVKLLLEKKRFESPLIEKFQKILSEIELKISEKIFNEKEFLEWMKDAKKDKLLHKIFSEMSLKESAIALVDYMEEALEIFEGGISKRSLQDLKDDLDYIKRVNPSYKEKLEARQKMLYTYADNSFQNLNDKEKSLKRWLRFSTEWDLNHAFNYIGPVDFSLGIMNLEHKELKRFIVKNLKTPAKYFIEDLFSGKINLNMAYGKNTISQSAENLAKELYKLYFVGRINISFEEDE